MTTWVQKRTDYAESLKKALEELVPVLSSWEEVERISVFGSFARGRLDLGTDLDILVIMRTKEPLPTRYPNSLLESIPARVYGQSAA